MVRAIILVKVSPIWKGVREELQKHNFIEMFQQVYGEYDFLIRINGDNMEQLTDNVEIINDTKNVLEIKTLVIK